MICFFMKGCPFNGKGIVFSRQGVSLIKGGSNTFIHDIVLGENYIVFHDRAVSLKGVSTVLRFFTTGCLFYRSRYTTAFRSYEIVPV